MYILDKNRSFRRNEQFCCDDDVGIVYTRDKYGGLQTPKGYELKIGNKKYLKGVEPKGDKIFFYYM